MRGVVGGVEKKGRLAVGLDEADRLIREAVGEVLAGQVSEVGLTRRRAGHGLDSCFACQHGGRNVLL